MAMNSCSYFRIIVLLAFLELDLIAQSANEETDSEGAKERETFLMAFFPRLVD